MRMAVSPEHRRFSFLQAFAARLGGESMGFLTFAGPLLGEATKVALLRKRVPLVHGVPALVVDKPLRILADARRRSLVADHLLELRQQFHVADPRLPGVQHPVDHQHRKLRRKAAQR